MNQQRRNTLVAVWLGLFAMLMIHVGPLISGAQALSDHAVAEIIIHAEHDHHPMQETLAHDGGEVDYHALMGHHNLPDGMPQWLANLEMCGYCELLTVSPPLIFVFFLALATVPAVQRLAVLPVPLQLQSAAHSLSYSRAPPVHRFT